MLFLQNILTDISVNIPTELPKFKRTDVMKIKPSKAVRQAKAALKQSNVCALNQGGSLGFGEERINILSYFSLSVF